MRTLLVLRHAKSDWNDGTLPDHDRPLNQRGRRDAPRVGDALAARGLIPDLVITSDAVRARETTEAVVRASGYAGDVQSAPLLYLAAPDDICAVLRTVEAVEARTIMIVGHNPGFSELVTKLTGEAVDLATATLAHVVLPIDRWTDLHPTTRGRLAALWRPRDS